MVVVSGGGGGFWVSGLVTGTLIVYLCVCVYRYVCVYLYLVYESV